jgi:signal transduction histidine kinase
VQNLLDNAVRVSEPGQQVSLEVAPLGVDEVKVSVSDNGPGIAHNDREKLFHRFIQGRGRRGRSGLGLYLCRQIVEAHKGTINVESTLGEGSTFWFTLPAAAEQTHLNCRSCL